MKYILLGVLQAMFVPALGTALAFVVCMAVETVGRL